MRRFVAPLLATLLAAVPSSLEAQMTWSIDAYGGAYVPAGKLFDEVFPGIGVLSLEQKTAFAAGGRVAVWPTGRIGVEAEGSYAFSDVEITCVIPDVCAAEGTAPASVLLGSLNLMYTLIDPPLDPVAVYISGGVGVVSRTGDAFRDIDSSTSIAGVVGLGLRYGVARGVRVRLDVKDYISSFEWTELNVALRDSGLDSGSSIQNDIMILGSIEFMLGGS